MSRAIKFRAWDKTFKSMIEDSNIYLNEGKISDIIYGCTKCECLNPNDFIVMQYTGMNDEDGKEIYEGDILAARVSSPGRGGYFIYSVVSYDNNMFVTIRDGDDYKAQAFGNIVVAGNIYENKELLQ